MTTLTALDKQRRDALPYTGYIDLDDATPGETITWNSWTAEGGDGKIAITLFPYANGSDYSGTLVERSNYRVLKGDEHVMRRSVLVDGGYGTFGIAYLGAPTRRIRELCKSLDGYPLLDESDHSDLEMETEQEAWSDWGRADFKRELVEAFDDTATDGTEVLPDELLTDELLDRTWYSFAGNHGDGGRVFEQGDSCHFYISEAIEWLKAKRCRGQYLVLGHVEYRERDYLSVMLDAFETDTPESIAHGLEMASRWDGIKVVHLTPPEDDFCADCEQSTGPGSPVPHECCPDGDSLGGGRSL